MTELEAKAAIESLRREIERHERLYRVENAPEISDEKFDDMLKELKRLEWLFPQFDAEDSPTKKIGVDFSEGFEKIPHLSAMLSLDNTFSAEELCEFDARLKKLLSAQEDLVYALEPKIDGAGISAVYENGALTRLLTRGDGETGDDITRNLPLLPSIPRKLQGDDIPELLEIRGEAYMTRAEFERVRSEKLRSEALKKEARASKKRQKNAEDALIDESPAAPQMPTEDEPQARGYANARNLTAGTLKLLDFASVPKRRLEAAFYSIGKISGLKNPMQKHSQLVGMLKAWGLPHLAWTLNARGAQEVIKDIERLDEERKHFGYATDGAVIKLDDIEQQRLAGWTAKAPRWAIAWKYRPERALTEVLSIDLQVGRTGAVTPVANVRRVEVSGTYVSRATLHNADEIARKDIRVGDTVLIEKAGEIIPAVIEVVKELRKKNSAPFAFPAACPECGTPLTRPEGEAVYRCPNFECPAQIVERLIHFASRDCMDIEGMGEKLCIQLYKNGLIKTPADIYKLKREDLDCLESFKEKKTQNLLNAIEESKSRELWRLIFALGIREVGERSAKDFAARFENLDALAKTKPEDLLGIDGVGERLCQNVLDFFESAHTVKLIEELRAAGLDFAKVSKARVAAANPLYGKSCALTGTLASLKRDAAKNILETFGARIASDVSGNTDYLIAGEKGGSKLKKAEALGVKILSEEDFLKLVDEYLKNEAPTTPQNDTTKLKEDKPAAQVRADFAPPAPNPQHKEGGSAQLELNI